MNIYLHVEISFRELESKLLLAVIAASRGHNVIISDLSILQRALRGKVLPPGIFHTKSLTPKNELINRNDQIIKNDIIITSLDEESGLLDFEYKEFAKARYSNQTIEQSSAIFCWGEHDTKTLKELYPKYSSKIFKTGSPRFDLWKSKFLENWSLPPSAPKKPFLLISSNLHYANFFKPFHNWGGFKSFNFNKNISYFKSNPELFKKQFNKSSEDTKKFCSFIEAIHYLSDNNDNYDIVLRPHPLENFEAWKVYLNGLSNVHVIREDSINPWIHNAFAVMHNSCTSAIEATISGKEVVTYIPFHQNYSWGEVPNSLGYRTETLKDLSIKINELFNKFKYSMNKNSKKDNSKLLLEKIYIDEKELAAEKILNIWEKLAFKNSLDSTNFLKLEFFLKMLKIKNVLGNICKNFLPGQKIYTKSDYKFPSLELKKIRNIIDKFQTILNLNKKLECKLLYDRTILIKRK